MNLTWAGGAIADSAAAAHISSNGSDHTFIDQDVTSGAAPVFAVTNMTGLPASPDSLLTTRGDIIREGVSGAERLALGTSGQVLTSDGTDAAWATPAGGGDPWFPACDVIQHFWPGSTTVVYGWGLHYYPTTSNPTVVDASSTLIYPAAGGVYLEQTTAATANDYTQVRAQLRHSYGAATWQAKTMVQVVDTTDIRIFVGVSSTWTPTAADEVFAAAAHNAMFRYSTSASDTNWKFITTDGSSSTVVDTGVAVAAGAWEMYIANLDGGTTYRWAIRAVGGTWTTGTVTTTLPGTGVDQRWQHNGIAVAASAKKTGFHRYTLASLSTVGAPA